MQQKPHTPGEGPPPNSHQRSLADYRRSQLLAQLGNGNRPEPTNRTNTSRSRARTVDNATLLARVRSERGRVLDFHPDAPTGVKADPKPAPFPTVPLQAGALHNTGKSMKRSLTDYKRVVLFDRLPGSERLECGITKEPPSFHVFVDEVLKRHADNTFVVGAVKGMLQLPGFCALEQDDQRSVITVINGPVLGSEVEGQRKWFTGEVWKAIQQRIALGVGQMGALPAQKQVEVLHSFLREPKENVTLLTADNGHAVLAFGWKPGEQRPLMHYGRWPAASGSWAFVKSPDSIMRRAFEPAHKTIYEFATYRVSLNDQRQLIEWLERAFGVNDLATGPRSRAFPLARVFVKFTISLLTILTKKRNENALVARGRATGGQLMKERLQ